MVFFNSTHLICEKHMEELVEFGKNNGKADEGGH